MEETPGKMYALASVMTVLPVIAIVLRYHARRITKAGFGWDDHLTLLALVCSKLEVWLL